MNPFPHARLEQRKFFYEAEFFPDKVESFFFIKPQFVALDYGSESRISKHPQKHTELLPPSLSFDLIKARVIADLPEKVMYDKNVYKDVNKCVSCMKFSQCFSCPLDNFVGQELVLEIQAKEMKCTSCKVGQVCPECVHLAMNKAQGAKAELLRHYERVEIVATGLGAQIHVKDLAALRLSFEERQRLAQELRVFSVHVPASAHERFALLPYSLNGVASRKIMPVNNNEPHTDKLIPAFLKVSPIEYFEEE